MNFYIDTRKMELVTENEIDGFIAPELYYDYLCSMDNNIRETYYVGDYGHITFTHPIQDSYITIREREAFFCKNKADLDKAILKKYSVPKEWYNKTLKDFGYEEYIK